MISLGLDNDWETYFFTRKIRTSLNRVVENIWRPNSAEIAKTKRLLRWCESGEARRERRANRQGGAEEATSGVLFEYEDGCG